MKKRFYVRVRNDKKEEFLKEFVGYDTEVGKMCLPIDEDYEIYYIRCKKREVNECKEMLVETDSVEEWIDIV